MIKQSRIAYDEVACVVEGVVGNCHVCRLVDNGDGYCQVKIGGRFGRKVLVHRWIYEKEVGVIPDGVVIDHHCRNRKCCNVLHMRLVTRRVNALENSKSVAALNLAKTHCAKGHAYDESNTKRLKSGARKCRICHREKRRRQRIVARDRKSLAVKSFPSGS